MELIFYPLDYDHLELNNKDIIRIFGRTQEGKSCCLLDTIQHFFYVLSNKQKEIQKTLEKQRIKSQEIDKNYLGNPVKALKIFAVWKQFKALSETIENIDSKAQILETDIKPITRYIIEKELKPLKKYKIKGELLNNSEEFVGLDLEIETDLVIKSESIEEHEQQDLFKPRTIAIDIETDAFEIGKGKILMIALVSDKFQKVLTWKKTNNTPEYVEHYEDEADMLEAFAKIIKKESPDVITGYFSDNFDLPYIRARTEKNKISMNLGPDNSKITFSRGRMISARIKGLLHIDIFRFIETTYAQYMESETLTLDEVAKELIGETKIKIDHLGKKTEDIKEHEWHEFFDYNLHDAKITYKLFEKIWPDIVGFTEVMQEPPFDVSRDGMSQHVEDYIIHNLKRFNEIATPKPSQHEIRERQNKERNIGAFVLQPEPKLYENLAIFDFTSYWPSIIVTFNLSRSTFLGTKKEKNATEVNIENKTYYFSKQPGFFPQLLAEIIEKRKQYKRELKQQPDALKQARSTAYKILANASYGYLGFFGARYYCYEAQGATTGISRKFIQEIIAKVNKEDYKVIYADTDGFALLLNKHTKEEALHFLQKLNKDLPGIMELELEDFYKRGIWVTKRTGEFGAKKKYALINEQEKLKIRGFETVRRDWCRLARDVQSNILKMILKEGNEEQALEYVKGIVENIKSRKIEKKQLLIKTQLKKPIEEYRAETPHVTIAKKMLEQGMPVAIGTVIEYFIAESEEESEKAKKKALVRERAKLMNESGEYDIYYYLHHQILPAVENIFQVFNINIAEILGEVSRKHKGQKTLGEF